MTGESVPEVNARPDASVMRGVIPYLGMDGRAGEAADFYMRAFGARDLGRLPMEGRPGQFMHIQLEINGGALMMSDGSGPEVLKPVSAAAMHLQLVVEDGDRWWARAIDNGCTILVPFQKMFWGDRWGMVADPFGIRWAFNEPG
jgi:PhnB protein